MTNATIAISDLRIPNIPPRPDHGGPRSQSLSPQNVRFYVLDPQQSQTISFAPLPDRTFGDPQFVLTATASSGLAVSFAADGTCTLDGATVTIAGAGTCTITASQPGSPQYGAAADVTRAFEIARAPQTIVFQTSQPDHLVIGTATTMSAIGGASGNPVVFTTLTADVCGVATLPGGMSATATAIGIGTCTVTTDQAGTDNYLPAPRLTLSVPVIFEFSGFLAPFDADANEITRLRPVVLRFAVIGATGPDALRSATSQPVACDTFESAGEATAATIVGQVSFDTDTSTVRVTIATERSWASTCRRIVVLLADGMEYGVIVRFR